MASLWYMIDREVEREEEKDCSGEEVYLQEDVEDWKNQINMFITTVVLCDIIIEYIFTDTLSDEDISQKYPWTTVHNQVFQIPSRILAKLYTSNQVIHATILRPGWFITPDHDRDNKENRFQLKILSKKMEGDDIHSLVQAYFFLLNKVFYFHELYGPFSEWFLENGDFGGVKDYSEDNSCSSKFLDNLKKEPDYDDTTGLYLLNGKKYGIFNFLPECCTPDDAYNCIMESLLKDGSHFYKVTSKFSPGHFILTIRLFPSSNIKSYLAKQFEEQMCTILSGLEDEKSEYNAFTDRWNKAVTNFLEVAMDPQPYDHGHNTRATKQRKLQSSDHKYNTRATKRSKPSKQQTST